MKKTNANPGPLLVLCAALLMSTGGLLIKLLPWGGMAVNGGRTLIAALVTYSYIRLTGRRLVTSRTVLGCAVCIWLCCLAFTFATQLTTAGNAVVIQYTSPVFVILYMALFFHRRPRRADLVACGVVFAGVLCFFIESLSGGGMLGNLLALVAAACYAVVFLVNMVPGADSFSAYFWSQAIGGIVGLPWLLTAPRADAQSWVVLVLLGVFQVSVAYILMARGLATTGPVTANVLCMVEPICNPLWVALVCGERLGTLSLVGIAVVLGGLLWYNLYNVRHKA